MEKPNKVRVENKRDVKSNIVFDSDSRYNIATVSIRSLLDAVVKVTGTSTGNQYIWHRAGDVVDVDVRDKDEILNKRRGRACCGGQSGKALFELA